MIRRSSPWYSFFKAFKIDDHDGFAETLGFADLQDLERYEPIDVFNSMTGEFIQVMMAIDPNMSINDVVQTMKEC